MAEKHEDSAWRELVQYSFLKVFHDDMLIDAAELAMLKKIALKDGVVDADERAVLAVVFKRVEGFALEPGVREEIARFCAEHGIEYGVDSF
jgi:hypothetical protein